MLGWFARSYLWQRRLHRRQRFFGLPTGLRVPARGAPRPGLTGLEPGPARRVRAAGAGRGDQGVRAHAEVLAHDTAWQGFGARTEFCIGGPAENLRLGAHLRSMLPGVEINIDSAPGPDQGAITVGGATYRLEKGAVEYVLLARLAAAGDTGNDRPVFLSSGQRGIANQAAARYLARHHARLTRKHGRGRHLLPAAAGGELPGVRLRRGGTGRGHHQGAAAATPRSVSQRDRSPAT